MEPEELAARIWPRRDVTLAPLGGGITNRNFRAEVDGEAFVLRIGGKDTELLGIDRVNEYRASHAAASLGVGPEVATFLEREGCLVTRFIDGSPVPPESMRRPETIERVAVTLRRIHDGPQIPGRFESFRVVEAYLSIALAHGVPAPAGYTAAKAVADRIESARGPQPPRPCHNDLLNANFIDDGESLRIVDWEYAAMGDPMFDLANFSMNHELDEDANRALVVAYFGEPSERKLACLTLMRFMSDFREAMWGVVQQGISELDFDFAGYAREHFARLERTAADRAFERAFDAVSS